MNGQHKRWFSERKEAEPELFELFQANANMLCSLEAGGWAHTIKSGKLMTTISNLASRLRTGRGECESAGTLIKNPTSQIEKRGFEIQFMATSNLGWRMVYPNYIISLVSELINRGQMIF